MVFCGGFVVEGVGVWVLGGVVEVVYGVVCCDDGVWIGCVGYYGFVGFDVLVFVCGNRGGC